jgi:hypothetical protein
MEYLNPNVRTIHTELTSAHKALTDTGIQTPDLMPIIDFPETSPRDEEIAQALLVSKKTGPFTDPKLQALLAEHIVHDDLAIKNTFYTRQFTQRTEAFLEHRPTLMNAIRERFADLAQVLEDNADAVDRVEDLSSINVTRVSFETVEAVQAISRADRTIDTLLRAWHLLIYLGDGFDAWNRPTLDKGVKGFVLADLTQDQEQAVREKPTAWNLVRQGIALDLAQDLREARERREEMQRRVEAQAQKFAEEHRGRSWQR